MHAPGTGGHDDASTADTATADEDRLRRSSTGPGVDGQALPCAFPGGCPNTVLYTGTGRRPKYCGQLVAGVVHVRSNAHRASKGQLTVVQAQPTHSVPDEGPTPESGSRPISTARATLEALHRDLVNTATTHQNVLGGLVDRIETAVGTVTDADAVATEIASVHRDARRRIDDAEAAADAAHARARSAEAATEAAHAARDSARAAGEQAHRDAEAARDLTRQATAERDVAIADAQRLSDELADATVARDAVTEQLATTVAERDELQRELATARSNLERLDAELATAADQIGALTDQQNQLRAEIAARRDELVDQRHRAELADQQRRHAQEAADAARQELTRQRQREEVERERLTTERDHARAEARAAEQSQHRDAQHLREAREEIAELRAQLEGAGRSLADHVAHAEQRLTDQRLAYEAHIRSLLVASSARQTPSDDGAGT
jgi:DNA repair exonuclease SbcCD ATPase subunit